MKKTVLIILLVVAICIGAFAIVKAKSANNGVQIKVTEREVSEEYALDQISKGGNIK